MQIENGRRFLHIPENEGWNTLIICVLERSENELEGFSKKWKSF
jgi:hypothetical protein